MIIKYTVALINDVTWLYSQLNILFQKETHNQHKDAYAGCPTYRKSNEIMSSRYLPYQEPP